MKQTKKSLSPFDDKRYILEDGYTTRAHGHWPNVCQRESTSPPIDPPMDSPMDSQERHPATETAMEVEIETTDLNGLMEGLSGMNLAEAAIPLPPAVIPSSNYNYLSSFW